VTPVTLPPGRLRLSTIPAATGSELVVKTIGMVLVAAITARTAGRAPPTRMTATLRLMRSAASAGARSKCPSAQRYSITTLRPSAKPVSPRPPWNPEIGRTHSAADAPLRNPTTGIADCCARAASGHTAAPPSNVINARRFIWPLPRLNQNDGLGTYHIELGPYVRCFTYLIGVQRLAREGRNGSMLSKKYPR